MDLNIFNKSNSSNTIAGSFSDTSKIQEIVEKLCAKRKALEEKIKNSDDATSDSLTLELLELGSAMKTFGVSETDYQIYLLKNKDISNS